MFIRGGLINMLSTVVILLHSRLHANVGHLTNREVWRRTEPVTYIMVFKFGVDHKDQMLWQCDTLILIFENLPWKYLFFAIANSYLFLIFLFPHRNTILFTLPDKVWTRLRCFSAFSLFLPLSSLYIHTEDMWNYIAKKKLSCWCTADSVFNNSYYGKKQSAK